MRLIAPHLHGASASLPKHQPSHTRNYSHHNNKKILTSHHHSPTIIAKSCFPALPHELTSIYTQRYQPIQATAKNSVLSVGKKSMQVIPEHCPLKLRQPPPRRIIYSLPPTNIKAPELRINFICYPRNPQNSYTRYASLREGPPMLPPQHASSMILLPKIMATFTPPPLRTNFPQQPPRINFVILNGQN